MADGDLHLSLRKSKKEFRWSYFHKLSKRGKVAPEADIFLACVVMGRNPIRSVVPGWERVPAVRGSQRCPW